MRKSSIFVLAAISLLAANDALAASDVTGSWAYGGPSDSGMWLKTDQRGSTIHFQLWLQRGAPSYHSGWIDGQFELSGASGAFRSTDYGTCEINFTFSRSSVQIGESDGKNDCGFGFSVHAIGLLHRTSSTKPKFDKHDPREAPASSQPNYSLKRTAAQWLR